MRGSAGAARGVTLVMWGTLLDLETRNVPQIRRCSPSRRTSTGGSGTPQLHDLGHSDDAIAQRVAVGWLVREHHGCFRLAGAPEDLAGRCAAAVLATSGGRGDPTVTARTALALHGILEDDGGPIHLVLPGRRRVRAGITLHRGTLEAHELLRVDGLPVATVTRALLDFAAREPASAVAHAVHETEVRRRLDAPVLLRAAQRRGSPLLRELAARRLPVDGEVRERLERRFAVLLRDHGFPTAQVNCRVRLRDPDEIFVLDAVWWEAGLAVELDGRQAHATAKAFDVDRRRDRRVAVQHGLQVVRATWRHVEAEPESLAADLWTLYRRGLGNLSHVHRP